MAVTVPFLQKGNTENYVYNLLINSGDEGTWKSSKPTWGMKSGLIPHVELK